MGKYIYKSMAFYDHKVLFFQEDENFSSKDCKVMYLDKFLGNRIYEDGKPFISPDVIRMMNHNIEEGTIPINIKKWEYLTFGDRPREEYFQSGKYIV